MKINYDCIRYRMARTIAWHNRDSFWKTIVSFSRSNSSTNCRKTFWLNRWPRTKPECDHMVYGMSLVYERGLLSKQHFNNTLKLTNDFFSLRVKWNFSKIRILLWINFLLLHILPNRNRLDSTLLKTCNRSYILHLNWKRKLLYHCNNKYILEVRR